jgi:hypothetical protein
MFTVINSNTMKTIWIFNSFFWGFLYLTSLAGFAQQALFNTATGNVEGRHYVGGLIGSAPEPAIVSYSYAKGNVVAQSYAGGLIGSNAGTISESYAVGVPSASSFFGGFAGNNTGDISSSYWDTERSAQLTSAGGIGRNTDEMTWPYAPNAYVGWDFSNIWIADEVPFSNDGYPVLRQNKVHQLQLRAYPPDGGTVVGGGYYLSNQLVRLVATAKSEFNLLGWYLGAQLITADPSLDWVVSADQTLTARFVRRPTSVLLNEEAEGIPLVRLYPNPVREFLWIDIQSAKEDLRVIRIYSALGYVIKEERPAIRGELRYNLNVQGLQSGIYFVHLQFETMQITKKIVVK